MKNSMCWSSPLTDLCNWNVWKKFQRGEDFQKSCGVIHPKSQILCEDRSVKREREDGSLRDDPEQNAYECQYKGNQHEG